MKRKIRKMRREEMEGRDKTNTNRREDEKRIRKTRMKMEERKQGERYEQRRGWRGTKCDKRKELIKRRKGI